MAGYYRSNSVSSASANYDDALLGDDFCEEVDERACTSSGGASACALPPELGKDSCTKSRPTENHNHCKKTKSKSDYRISSKSDRQNGLSAGSSADPRYGKNPRMFKNGREMSHVGSAPWGDSDDDFADAKYRIPLAQRIRSTCERSIVGTSGQTLPSNSQTVETTGVAPSQSEVSLGQLGAEMPSTSRIVWPRVPILSPSSDDQFDVYDFFNSPSTTEHKNKLSRGEYGKQKSTKINHKSSKEYPSSKLSSRAIASRMENAPNTGSTNGEVQTGIASHVLTGIWDDPVDDIINGNIGNVSQHSTRSTGAEASTSSGNGGVGSRADGNTERRRYRQKRQRADDDCLNKTFDMLDECGETATRASRSPSASTAVCTDSTFAVPPPKSVSTTKLGREKKIPRLCHTGSSSLHRGGGSSVFHEAKLRDNVVASRSNASSLFDQSECAENGESHGSGSVCQSSAAVESSSERLPVTDRMNVQVTSVSYRTVKKSRHTSRSYNAAGGHRYKTATATAAHNDGELTRTLSRRREISCDDDDADNLGDHLSTDRNTTRRGTESIVSARDDVIVIGSDNEETVTIERGTEQAGNSYQTSSVESGIAADGNSGRNVLGLRPRRTARMSCRGG